MHYRLTSWVRQGLVCLLGAAFFLTGCESATTGLVEETDLPTAQTGDVIEGRYIVVLNEGASKNLAATLADLTEGYGLQSEHVYQTALPGFSARMDAEAAERLQHDARVAFVEPDRVITLAPKGGKPGGGGGPQVTPWGITRVGGPGGATSRTAYIIDSGIDMDHADLNVDAGCSANFVARGKDSPNDGNGHGTHVAGTVAALDNSQDVVGVAPGARLCAVRVLDNSGSGSYSGVIAGVDFVAANGSNGDVANMSLGGPPSAALDAAVVNAASSGIKFALAAGNEGADANGSSPARVNHPNVYTVSAIGQDDCLTSWSNYGSPVDFAAPGAGILSTKNGGGTTTMSGTSMASPHVAGLLLYGNPSSDGTACNDPDGNPDPIAHF